MNEIMLFTASIVMTGKPVEEYGGKQKACPILNERQRKRGDVLFFETIIYFDLFYFVNNDKQKSS